jgi:hypothetical protein
VKNISRWKATIYTFTELYEVLMHLLLPLIFIDSFRIKSDSMILGYKIKMRHTCADNARGLSRFVKYTLNNMFSLFYV